MHCNVATWNFIMLGKSCARTGIGGPSKQQQVVLMRRNTPCTYWYWGPVKQQCVVLRHWNTVVGGKCAVPSALWQHHSCPFLPILCTFICLVIFCYFCVLSIASCHHILLGLHPVAPKQSDSKTLPILQVVQVKMSNDITLQGRKTGPQLKIGDSSKLTHLQTYFLE